MNFPFPIDEIVERSHDGRLLTRGAKWIELNASRAAIAFLFLLGAPFFAYPFLHEIFEIGVRVQSYHVAGVLIALAAMVVACWVIQREICKRRSVIFHVDGTIRTPFGFPANERLLEMPYDQADIGSIETVFNQDHQWEVLVYMRNGRILTWTQYQSKYDAHLIAVTLTNALQEIRDTAAISQSSGLAADIDGAVRAAMSGVTPGEKVQVVID